MSENELEQFSKAAKQKPDRYDPKTESNRYKQQPRTSSSKATAKIEFVEDKSELVNSPSEPLIQYKKFKEPTPVIHEYKKREPKFKYDDLKEDAKEELDLLLGDEVTTRAQKRWKKKESEDEKMKQDRQKKAPTAKRHRPRKKTDRELNLEDEALSFQLVHRNDNYTDSNRVKNFPSSDVPYNMKNNDKYNREMKANDKSRTFKQHDIDSKQQDYPSNHYEKHKSKYKARNGDRHAPKSYDESLLNNPTTNPVDAPMLAPMYASIDGPVYAPMDVPMDEPIEDPMEIHFNSAKVPETTKGNNFIQLSPRVNAFNIGAELNGHEQKLDNKRKNFIVATSGNLALPMVSIPELTHSKPRGGSTPKP